NFIGTNAAGNAAIGSSGTGVFVFDSASNTTIGGTNPGTGNVISGNQNGVEFFPFGGASGGGNLVQGNLIGTNAAGESAIGNTDSGVLVNGWSGVTIGGTVSGAGNVISGNTTGVLL